MGSLYAKDVLDIALAEVGYQANGKWNKFADELDKVNFFTGCGDKQGLDYCSVFTSWSAYKAVRNSNGDFDPDVWDAHYFLYQPDSNDCAAVVGYVVDYYARNNAYYTNPKDLERGDQMIFQNSKGYSHTGWCYDWDEKGAYTVEGNINGGKVGTKFYPYSEFGNYIAGFGRPRYDGWEYPEKVEAPVKDDNKPEPEPTPEPAPDPVQTPVSSNQGTVYTVCVGSWLNIRTEPTSESTKIGELYDGAKVIVYEQEDGWARIGDNMWVFADFLE